MALDRDICNISDTIGLGILEWKNGAGNLSYFIVYSQHICSQNMNGYWLWEQGGKWFKRAFLVGHFVSLDSSECRGGCVILGGAYNIEGI